MANFIGILGSKGGAGKSTVAHLLSYGLSLSGRKAVCVTTDRTQLPLSREGRRYAIADGRTEDGLEKIIERCDTFSEESFAIIDGSSKELLPQIIADRLSLIILPFRDSLEDVRFLLEDWKRYPQALALPSQWVTNVWAQQILSASVLPLLTPYQNRILSPIPMMNASKLLFTDPLGHLPTVLNQVSRQLARDVLFSLSPERSQGGMMISIFPEQELGKQNVLAMTE